MSGIVGKRVLFVEDEFLIAMLASDMLEEIGCIPVGPASTSAQAYGILAGESVDAVLLDLNLQGYDTVELAEALDVRSTPYLVASGYDSRPASGAPFLAKPYTIAALATALEKLLG